MVSIFTDKTKMPDDNDLKTAVKDTFEIWNSLKEFTLQNQPKAICTWNYPGAKYGWSFKISDKKRAIIYLLPRDSYFKAAFVFGKKAVDQIMNSSLQEEIKTELINAKEYAEGRGIRIDVKDLSIADSIKELIKIKINN